jgi:hypothetical protein
MHKTRFNLLSLLVAGIILFSGGCNLTKMSHVVSREKLAEGFITPPDSIQTSVYWYWISDNISKEGVVNDLHAMKKAGINRAFIGNIGLDDTPYGSIKMLSEEWWEILHLALKTATELNIEIGIFNSPGWSQSGGPWVKAENAMRYLASFETRVKGPVKFSGKLAVPTETFQDVKVIAYPVPKDNDLILLGINGNITSTPGISNLSLLFDGDSSTGISFPKGETFTLDFKSKQAYTARSLTIQSTENRVDANVLLQALNEQGGYITLKEFNFKRMRSDLNVGFDPYAPLIVTFPAVTARNFRLIFTFPRIIPNHGLSEVRLSSAARMAYVAEKTFAKMFQGHLPMWDAYLWDKQAELDNDSLVIKSDEVIDISGFLSADGTLDWDVPQGDWVIVRTGMVPTGTTNSPASPEATGYEVDKMSKEHTQAHFYGHMGEILRRIPEADRKSFKVVVQDSYEKGGQNFTDGFLEEFAEVYGYDPLPYLPVYSGMVVNSPMSSDRFLWDMRRLVANKIAYDYVAGLREVSHKHGLTTWLENYGHWGFPSEFLMYGGQSDEIGGEFWSNGLSGIIENRAATSCGHIYGKRKISSESHTSSGKTFARTPAELKARGDRFFAEGINNTLLHVYIHQPYEDKNPGINAWFGNEFNRKNTWFSQIDVFIEYLKRNNYMMQQGLYVADVAYFIGEDTPKMTGITDPPLPIGYQFDYMNAEVIEKYMTVKDGLITLPHGTRYRMMVLPKQETMRPGLLAKIKQLVRDGAIILGPPPTHSPSLQNQPLADQQVVSLASELWGDVDGINIKSRRYGKGVVMNGMDMKEAMALINCIPDCKLPEDSTIHYAHRKLGNGDIYFLSNQTNEEQVFTPEFRVTGMQPELWETTTGSIRKLVAFEQKKQVTAVPLKLAPAESVFVVFLKPARQTKVNHIETNYPAFELVDDFKEPWTVNFNTAFRGPAKPVIFESLIDWTTSSDDRIKYYSGTAFYHNTFTIDLSNKNNRFMIDLGALTAMAKVIVNGVYAGGVWTTPYRLDITDFVKNGKNEVKIELVNNWMNRIIGDQKLPEKERATWCFVQPYTAISPLQPSGLFGPVQVLSVKY